MYSGARHIIRVPVDNDNLYCAFMYLLRIAISNLKAVYGAGTYTHWSGIGDIFKIFLLFEIHRSGGDRGSGVRNTFFGGKLGL